MKKKYPFKQALITGLLVGTFAICAFTIADSLNKHLGWGVSPATLRGISGLLTLVILGIGIYTGMQCVKKANAGTLTYGRAILAGVTVAVTTGLLTAFLSFIYCQYLNPGYAAYMVEEGRKAMLAAGELSAEEIAVQTAALQKEFSTPVQVMQAVVGQSVCGTVISLVMGLFVRTQK